MTCVTSRHVWVCTGLSAYRTCNHCFYLKKTVEIRIAFERQQQLLSRVHTAEIFSICVTQDSNARHVRLANIGFRHQADVKIRQTGKLNRNKMVSLVIHISGTCGTLAHCVSSKYSSGKTMNSLNTNPSQASNDSDFVRFRSISDMQISKSTAFSNQFILEAQVV